MAATTPIPSRIETGYIENLTETQEAAFQQFKAQLTPEEAAGGQEPDYLRFLRARKFNVANALKMYRECLKWRAEFGIDGITAAECEEQMQCGEFIVHGEDKEGRPLITITSRLHDPVQYPCNRTLRCGLHMAEGALKKHEYPIETFTAIFDLGGMTRKNLDNSLTVEMVKVLQNYYPERLGLACVINAPWIYTIIWTLIKPFLDERTAKKIVVLGSDYKEKLLEKIPAENLLESLGGKMKIPEQFREAHLGKAAAAAMAAAEAEAKAAEASSSSS